MLLLLLPVWSSCWSRLTSFCRPSFCWREGKGRKGRGGGREEREKGRRDGGREREGDSYLYVYNIPKTGAIE